MFHMHASVCYKNENKPSSVVRGGTVRYRARGCTLPLQLPDDVQQTTDTFKWHHSPGGVGGG
jgi:hypothetical protein